MAKENEIRDVVKEMRAKAEEAKKFHSSVVDRVTFHNFVRRLEIILGDEK